MELLVKEDGWGESKYFVWRKLRKMRSPLERKNSTQHRLVEEKSAHMKHVV